MNARQIGLGIVCADFSALTAYTVYRYGYLGWYRIITANAATLTIFVDLAIALGLVTVWMWRDARERGESFLGYALVTLVFGSVGPLLYLIRRAGTERRRPTPAVAQGARA